MYQTSEGFQASFSVLMMPYMLSPGFLTFFCIDWEARNCIPAGTIQQAMLSGGESSPSLKYTRGELTAVEFLQELGQKCFEIVSHFPLLSLCFLTAGKWDPAMWEPGGSVRKEELF